jgi:LacI family transcriptional regulator
VLVVTSDLDSRQLTSFRQVHLPLVAIDPVHAPEADVTSIGVTNWTGGFAATEHLVALGHRRIAYIGGPAGAAINLARRHGYHAAMDMAALPVADNLVVDGGFGFDAGARLGGELLRLADRPTAIFAVTDLAAMGVIQAAHGLGLRVPEDLSVVGFDDTYMAAWATPALTTVHTPLQDMGRLAVRTLVRLMEGSALDSHHIELATSLVVRSSTAPLPR